MIQAGPGILLPFKTTKYIHVPVLLNNFVSCHTSCPIVPVQDTALQKYYLMCVFVLFHLYRRSPSFIYNRHVILKNEAFDPNTECRCSSVYGVIDLLKKSVRVPVFIYFTSYNGTYSSRMHRRVSAPQSCIPDARKTLELEHVHVCCMCTCTIQQQQV